MVGVSNSNPILDTHVYDDVFPDVSLKQYAARVISENMYSQVDVEWYQYQLMDKIVDHKTNVRADHSDDDFVISRSGRKT